MALSEFEIQRIKKAAEVFLADKRPPVHIRQELDIGYRVAYQSVEVFEVRPNWQDKSDTIEYPAAKATFVKTQKVWKIYWMRRDMKWHSYEPDAKVKTIEDFFKVISADQYGCFWG